MSIGGFMIKDNQKVFNRLLVLLDAIITGASFILSYFIKFYILVHGPGVGVLPVSEYVRMLIFIVPGYLLLYYRCGVYSPKRTVRKRFEIYGIVQANTLGIAALIIVLYMIIKQIDYSRSVMVMLPLESVSKCSVTVNAGRYLAMTASILPE